MEMIQTTKGMLDKSSLRQEVKRENVPCGKSVETSYYLGDELVRRDQLIEATNPLVVEGHTGDVK